MIKLCIHWSTCLSASYGPEGDWIDKTRSVVQAFQIYRELEQLRGKSEESRQGIEGEENWGNGEYDSRIGQDKRER